MIRLVIGAAVLWLSSALAVLAHDGQDHASPGESAVFPPEHLLAPNIPVVDRAGRSAGFVDRYGASGAVVISFTYASCTTVCPVANAILSEVQAELGDVTLLTVSVDPARDTPEAMRQSAEAFAAGANWEWVAASVADTPQLLAAFGVPAGPLEAHDPMFLIGDVGQGTFVRILGLPQPEQLVEIVREATGSGR